MSDSLGSDFDGLSPEQLAQLPAGLIDLGGKAMLEIDDETINACREVLGEMGPVLDAYIELGRNLKLNNEEGGVETTMAGLLGLTVNFDIARLAQVYLAFMVARTVWEEADA